MLNDTFKERYEKSHEKELITRIRTLLNDFNVDGLKDVILEMESMKEEGFYKKFLEAYKREGPYESDLSKINYKKKFFREQKGFEDEIPNTRLFAEAYINLYRPFQHDLINIYNIYAMYQLFEIIYEMDICETIDKDTSRKIHLNGLDSRITFNSDEFDDFNIIHPPENFFLELKNIKWQSKESKMLFNKLNKIKMRLLYELANEIKFKRLESGENSFLKYIAACNALKNNRNGILPEDIVHSYKTYFKLLKTDITRYKSDASNMFNGAVICENCGGYYLLKKGESPSDLNEECGCGGKLEYIDSIKDIQLKHPIESPELKVISLNILAGVLLICIPFIITCYIITFLKMDFSKLSIAIIGGPILFTTLIIAKLLSDRFDLKS